MSAKEPRPVAWKVEIDYQAAKVLPGSATKTKGLYRNRQGVQALITNALAVGVHPRFINVQKVYGEWVPDGPVTTCPECKQSFDEPSPDCGLQRRVINRNRDRKKRRDGGAGGYMYEELELPHSLYPRNITIAEQELVP